MSGQAFPIFTVGDIAAAESFYAQLGFVRAYAFPPDGEPGFVSMARDGDSIGLAAGPADDAVALWVYVDDVDATFALLRDGDAPVVEEPTDQPWGERDAAVADPDGYPIHLTRSLADSWLHRR